MSLMEKILTVEHRKNQYTLVKINHSNTTIPILLDRSIYKKIRSLNKKWYINDKNHIYCLHQKNETTYPVYLHDIVIKLSDNTEFKYNVPVLHINNIHFDNRLENLQYDIKNKDYSKNMKKKKRTIDLEEHGIDVNKLPTYLWYLKPDTTHGARFVIDIPGQVNWRSTASRHVSLKYKLEEAKKYLRYLKETRPELFKYYSMNGDMTERGKQLFKEYKMTIAKAGYTIDEPKINNTDLFINEDTNGLNGFENYLLNRFDPETGLNDIQKIYGDYVEHSKK